MTWPPRLGSAGAGNAPEQELWLASQPNLRIAARASPLPCVACSATILMRLEASISTLRQQHRSPNASMMSFTQQRETETLERADNAQITATPRNRAKSLKSIKNHLLNDFEGQPQTAVIH